MKVGKAKSIIRMKKSGWESQWQSRCMFQKPSHRGSNFTCNVWRENSDHGPIFNSGQENPIVQVSDLFDSETLLWTENAQDV